MSHAAPRRRPIVSVVLPAHRASHFLLRSLAALAASDLPREQWELIVVDDASGDDTPSVAAEYADTVVRLPGSPHGPAYARNRGCEVARGEILVFVDADVCVHPDALRQFVAALEQNPDVGAVFGSYDDRPDAPGLISQYQNLVHHFTHHRDAGESDSFWAGCGAVRRSVFEVVGMFDEWHFSRPQIEDIEFGNRVRALGHRILLRPEIQGTHLKRWQLRDVVRMNLRDRGIPWARLLAHRGAILETESLNVRHAEKWLTASTWLSWAAIVVGLAMGDRRVWIAGIAGLALVPIANHSLMLFFARRRGPLFALGTIPLQLLYYTSNGISVILGVLLQQLIGPPLPHPTVDAFSEVGARRWPPVPRKRGETLWNHPS